MSRAWFISACVIVTLTRATEQLTCEPGEIVADCPTNCPTNCATDHCPTYEGEDQRCPKPAVCGKPKCKCGFNMRRLNGTCIRTQDCPPFPCKAPNTEYVSCPSYCPTDDCSQATPDGRCPLPGNIFIVVECFPKCRCIKGYWKYNGICVPYKDCPPK